MFSGGLSPLARGTLNERRTGYNARRFIPAGAGNSLSPSAVARARSVYPRWRGELPGRPAPPELIIGLSPLARGTPMAFGKRHQHVRFIPAGAGNSTANQLPEPTSPVYPRWRGELHCNPSARAISRGLSPLARGTHDIELSIYLFFRFIPAGAGNSCFYSSRLAQIAVYPRWRGELILFAAESLCRYGLSPLARGTPPIFPYRRVAERFIPAGAGNSLNITYY